MIEELELMDKKLNIIQDQLKIIAQDLQNQIHQQRAVINSIHNKMKQLEDKVK